MDENITSTTEKTFGLIRDIGAVVDEVRDIATDIDAEAAAGATAPELPPIIRRGLDLAQLRAELAETRLLLIDTQKQLEASTQEAEQLRTELAEEQAAHAETQARLEQSEEDAAKALAANDTKWLDAIERGFKAKEYVEEYFKTHTSIDGWGAAVEKACGIDGPWVMPPCRIEHKDGEVVSLQSLFASCTNLLYCCPIDMVNVTDISLMFSHCSSLMRPPVLDTSRIRNFKSVLQYNNPALTDWPDWDFSSGENLQQFFQKTPNVRRTREVSLPMCTNLHFLFQTTPIEHIGAIHAPLNRDLQIIQDTYGVCRIDSLDCQSIAADKHFICSSASFGTRFGNLRYMKLLNLGKSPDEPKNGYCFTFPNWGDGSEENRQSLVDTLITHSYDRTAAGMPSVPLTLHRKVAARLSEEEKATITAKGFTITIYAYD